MSDLPARPKKSEQKVVEFFDFYYVNKLEFAANEFDAVVGFFIKKNFQKTAAISVAQVVLNQAKLDNVPVFSILDTLSGYDKIQLSVLVTTILNKQRDPTSKLGYFTPESGNQLEARNIIE